MLWLLGGKTSAPGSPSQEDPHRPRRADELRAYPKPEKQEEERRPHGALGPARWLGKAYAIWSWAPDGVSLGGGLRARKLEAGTRRLPEAF